MATKIDTSNLEENLKTLSGLDFEDCEKAERAAGNTQPLIQFSAGFLIRLAARALHMNYNELKALPLNEYVRITGTVTTFLYSSSDEDTIVEDAKVIENPSEK